MNKIQKRFTICLYIFIILNSMLPNNTNIQKVQKLNTVIPFKTQNTKNTNTEYSFKIVELFNSFFN